MTPDVHLWPSVDYPERKRLPAASGVYVLMDSANSLLYVGASVNIRHRLGAKDHPATKLSQPFRVAYLIIDNAPERELIEHYLIENEKPIRNQRRAMLSLNKWNAKKGIRLKVKRAMLKLKQKDVARKVGITAVRLCRIEAGTSEPAPDELKRIKAELCRIENGTLEAKPELLKEIKRQLEVA